MIPVNMILVILLMLHAFTCDVFGSVSKDEWMLRDLSKSIMAQHSGDGECFGVAEVVKKYVQKSMSQWRCNPNACCKGEFGLLMRFSSSKEDVEATLRFSNDGEWEGLYYYKLGWSFMISRLKGDANLQVEPCLKVSVMLGSVCARSWLNIQRGERCAVVLRGDIDVVDHIDWVVSNNACHDVRFNKEKGYFYWNVSMERDCDNAILNAQIYFHERTCYLDFLYPGFLKRYQIMPGKGLRQMHLLPLVTNPLYSTEYFAPNNYALKDADITVMPQNPNLNLLDKGEADLAYLFFRRPFDGYSAFALILRVCEEEKKLILQLKDLCSQVSKNLFCSRYCRADFDLKPLWESKRNRKMRHDILSLDSYDIIIGSSLLLKDPDAIVNLQVRSKVGPKRYMIYEFPLSDENLMLSHRRDNLLVSQANVVILESAHSSSIPCVLAYDDSVPTSLNGLSVFSTLTFKRGAWELSTLKLFQKMIPLMPPDQGVIYHYVEQGGVVSLYLRSQKSGSALGCVETYMRGLNGVDVLANFLPHFLVSCQTQLYPCQARTCIRSTFQKNQNWGVCFFSHEECLAQIENQRNTYMRDMDVRFSLKPIPLVAGEPVVFLRVMRAQDDSAQNVGAYMVPSVSGRHVLLWTCHDMRYCQTFVSKPASVHLKVSSSEGLFAFYMIVVDEMGGEHRNLMFPNLDKEQLEFFGENVEATSVAVPSLVSHVPIMAPRVVTHGRLMPIEWIL